MSDFLIPDESHTYQLGAGESVKIRFFAADSDLFQHFLEDHVLSDSEPWWDRLIGVKFRKSLGQKMRSGNVFLRQEAMLAAFRRCSPVLHAGILRSARFPVYVAFTEQRRRLDSAEEWHETGGYYFVSSHGLLIVVRDGILRTAYFCAASKAGNSSKSGNWSNGDLFREAWKSVKDKVRASLCRDRKHGREYKYINVGLVTPENWERCPNLERRKDLCRTRNRGSKQNGTHESCSPTSD